MTTRVIVRLIVAVGVVAASTAAIPAIPAQAASTSPNSTIRSYFQALASDNPRVTPKAVTLSAPGSPAGNLALHELALAQLTSLGHGHIPRIRVQVVKPAVFLCAPGAKPGPACPKFTDFQTDSRGRLVTFMTDNGPLADRIRFETGQTAPIVSPSGMLGTVKLYSAYETSSGALAVVAEVLPPPTPVTAGSGGNVVVHFELATYVGPDGKTVAPNVEYSTKNAQHGVLRSVWLFPNESFGGHLVLPTSRQVASPALAGTAQLLVN